MAGEVAGPASKPPGEGGRRTRSRGLDLEKAARTVRRRYDRIAGVYDAFEGVVESLIYRRWRRIVWDHVEGEPVLEVGVGTGKNLPYHPRDREIVAVDLSARMMSRAVQRARDHRRLHFAQMDAQRLGFPDASFDTVVATFVFCSVPDPEVGLGEIRRVLRPGGRLVLLEHVLSGIPGLRRFMRLVNPVVVRLTGTNIDRETVETVRGTGFELEELWDCGVGDIFKIVVAHRPGVAGGA